MLIHFGFLNPSFAKLILLSFLEGGLFYCLSNRAYENKLRDDF